MYHNTIEEFRDYIFNALDTCKVSCSCLEYALNTPYTTDKPLIMEFGVYTGTSLKMISQVHPDATILGFDCFHGLPETWRSGYSEGSFNLAGHIPDMPDNTIIVKGYFENTLPRVKNLINDKKIDMMHIDCDIYSSTKCVFDTFAENIKDGTILVFDELFNYPGYMDHELKALYEFMQNHPEKSFIPLACQNSPWAAKDGEETWGQQAVIRVV